jgi:hypothetical protein
MTVLVLQINVKVILDQNSQFHGNKQISPKSKYDGTAVYSPTHAVTAPTYIGKAEFQPKHLKFQLTKSFEKNSFLYFAIKNV